MDKDFSDLRISMRIYDIARYLCIIAFIYCLFNHGYIASLILFMSTLMIGMKADIVMLEYKDEQFGEFIKVIGESAKKEIEKPKTKDILE